MKKTGRCDEGGQQILSFRACRPRSYSSVLMACDHHQHDNTGGSVCVYIYFCASCYSMYFRCHMLRYACNMHTCLLACALRVEART